MAPIWSQQFNAKEYSSIWHSCLFSEILSHFSHLQAKILQKQPKHGPNMDQTWPLYGPNNFTINGILLFNMHYSPVKIWAISGIQKQRYCRNSKIMDLIWPKHGPNMVLLIKHNIDMSLGPICLSPESFISLVSLESQLKVRLVNCPLTDRQMDTTNSRVVPHWGGN